MNDDLQLREIFHFCFLERLLRMADPTRVNLRFFFHSPRYSEDMDLDVLGGSVATLKKNGYKLLQDPAFRRALRTYGIVDIEANDDYSGQVLEFLDEEHRREYGNPAAWEALVQQVCDMLRAP